MEANSTGRQSEPVGAPLRLLRIRPLMQKTGLSESAIYRLIRQGDFPKPVRLAAKTVAWVEVEVDDFLRRRMAAREEMTS